MFTHIRRRDAVWHERAFSGVSLFGDHFPANPEISPPVGKSYVAILKKSNNLITVKDRQKPQNMSIKHEGKIEVSLPEFFITNYSRPPIARKSPWLHFWFARNLTVSDVWLRETYYWTLLGSRGLRSILPNGCETWYNTKQIFAFLGSGSSFETNLYTDKSFIKNLDNHPYGMCHIATSSIADDRK